jgi:hypothetical protein
MLVGLGVVQRRKEPHVEVGAHAPHGHVTHPVGDHQIGVEREVWAVLLDRSERLDEDRAIGDHRRDVGGSKLVETTGRWDSIGDGRHSVTLRARCRSARE